MQRHTHAVQLRIYVVLTGCRMILFAMQSQRELVTDVCSVTKWKTCSMTVRVFAPWKQWIMLYNAEVWPITKDDTTLLEGIYTRMTKMLCTRVTRMKTEPKQTNRCSSPRRRIY